MLKKAWKKGDQFKISQAKPSVGLYVQIGKKWLSIDFDINSSAIPN